MVEKRSLEEFTEVFKNLNTQVRRKLPAGKKPFKPTLILSFMILQKEKMLDLREVSIDYNDKNISYLEEVFEELLDAIDHGGKKDIFMPLTHLVGKEDQYIFELSPISDIKVEEVNSWDELLKMSFDPYLVEHMEDCESRKKLIDALLDDGYLFSMDTGYKDYLEEGKIKPELKEKFEEEGIELSPRSELRPGTNPEDDQWFVHDGRRHSHRIKYFEERDEIKVYDLAYFTESQSEKLKKELKNKGLYVDGNGDSDMPVMDDMNKQQETDIAEEAENHAKTSNFFEFLHDKGVIFDNEIVETFLLSLKVKPFVILTGTTGTGKTKLAQLYGQYIDQKNFHIEADEDKIVTDVKVGKSPDSKGWTLSKEDFFEVFSDLEKLEKQYSIKVDEIDGRGHLQLTPRLFYDSDSREIIERLRSLAKEDPSQKIRLEIEVGENMISNGRKTDRGGRLYEIIPVGSDWTDNKNIVGFYNVITGEYQETPALDLIFEATRQEKYPYMIILDEMNLSHVERYFSDFLSAIESGEKIPLHTKEGLSDVPTDLSVPDNIFIIGTVNIDETTYMFSPKVLDRANTIEFLTVPAIEYMGNKASYDPPKGDTVFLEDPLSSIDLRDTSIDDLRDRFEKVNVEDGRSFWDVYSEELNKFQTTLKKANFDFGFRVINEITRFMYASWRYEKQPEIWKNWRRFFDAQIKQKMLPKVHGSQRELGNVLKDLFKLCYRGSVEKKVHNLTGLENDDDIIYLSSALKIKEMSDTLYNQRFVSFTK